MEVIRLSGYTEDEKMEIAKRFLVRKQLEQTGLTSKSLVFAGGDAVTGAATVILAAGAGKRAAQAMHDALAPRQ